MREDWCARVRAREQSSERASGEQIEFSCVRGSVIITSIAIGGRRGVRRHFISYSMVVGDICCGRSRRGVCRSRSRRHRSSLSLCSRSSLLGCRGGGCGSLFGCRRGSTRSSSSNSSSSSSSSSTSLLGFCRCRCRRRRRRRRCCLRRLCCRHFGGSSLCGVCRARRLGSCLLLGARNSRRLFCGGTLLIDNSERRSNGCTARRLVFFGLALGSGLCSRRRRRHRHRRRRRGVRLGDQLDRRGRRGHRLRLELCLQLRLGSGAARGAGGGGSGGDARAAGGAPCQACTHTRPRTGASVCGWR